MLKIDLLELKNIINEYLGFFLILDFEALTYIQTISSSKKPLISGRMIFPEENLVGITFLLSK